MKDKIQIVQYTLTENQVLEMLEKLSNNVTKITNKKGEYTIGSSIVESMNSTIKFYLEKNCKK